MVNNPCGSIKLTDGTEISLNEYDSMHSKGNYVILNRIHDEKRYQKVIPWSSILIKTTISEIDNE